MADDSYEKNPKHQKAEQCQLTMILEKMTKMEDGITNKVAKMEDGISLKVGKDIETLRQEIVTSNAKYEQCNQEIEVLKQEMAETRAQGAETSRKVDQLAEKGAGSLQEEHFYICQHPVGC